MAAPKGNKFWAARSTHGRKPIFPGPDELWMACCEYFEWVDDNPIYETKAFAYQGIVTQEQVPKMRAMTKEGLFRFLDIGRSTWDLYKSRNDFMAVCEDVENIIREQKFTGAAAGLLNHAIIASDLGLNKDAQPTTVVNNIMPVPIADSVDEWERVAQQNQSELLGGNDS